MMVTSQHSLITTSLMLTTPSTKSHDHLTQHETPSSALPLKKELPPIDPYITSLPTFMLSFFFFLMTRPPRRSPLFPYTPFSRSPRPPPSPSPAATPEPLSRFRFVSECSSSRRFANKIPVTDPLSNVNPVRPALGTGNSLQR